jgi:two-component system, chemotaxis family, chemotaxis protein CheY
MPPDQEHPVFPDLADKTIMVVEDTGSSRILVSGLLRGLGVGRVVTAADGREALDKMTALSLRPDLVLCDWVMPNMDGLELLTRLKAQDPGIKFVMMTVKTEPEAVISAKQHGVDGYIAKPFTRESIINALRKALGLPA